MRMSPLIFVDGSSAPTTKEAGLVQLDAFNPSPVEQDPFPAT